MARPRSSRIKSGPRRPVWAVVGLALFLAVDVGLVGFALSTTRHTQSNVPETLPTIASATASDPAASPTSAPVAKGSDGISALFLAPTGATTAWRATSGSCGGTSPLIETTADGGLTWVPRSTGDLAVKQILALSADADTDASIVAESGADCSANVFSTFTSGEFWKAYPEQLSARLFVAPSDGSPIMLNGVQVSAPCPGVSQVQAANGQPLVLCGGAVFQRDSTTGAWANLGVDGAVAIGPADSGVVLAVEGAADCAGVAVDTLSLDGSGEQRVGCVAIPPPTTPVAIGQAGTTVWLWGGAKVSVSLDGGITW